jgi:hypothetical protein
MYKGRRDQMERTLAAWNWGQANFPIDGSIDSWYPIPKETRDFINFVLNK